MNYLVTGGAGFIGLNFVRFLQSKITETDKILVYDNLTYAAPAGSLEILKTLGVRLVKADIGDKKLFSATLREYKIGKIINFAAQTHVDRSILAPDGFFETNLLGTVKMLDVLVDRPKIQFHHVSTDEVFGCAAAGEKFNELSRYNAGSPYSASKAAAEQAVFAFVKTYGIKATISIASNNFGPYCHPEKLIPLTITRALLDEQIPVYGDGLQKRDWIHVTDHCEGIWRILTKGKNGESYILSSGETITNLELLNLILKIMKKPESLLQYVSDRKGHDLNYSTDNTKAVEQLKFQIRKPLKTYLAEVVDWYKSNREWWLPLKKSADVISNGYLRK